MTGGADMKDIDDIYDMENYDSDDSPGEYVITGIFHEHEVRMTIIAPKLEGNKCHASRVRVITSLYTCNVKLRRRSSCYPKNKAMCLRSKFT